MSHLTLAMGVLLGMHSCLLISASDLTSSSEQQPDRTLEYAIKRGQLLLPADLLDSRERRATGSGMGSSFIRFGRSNSGLSSSGAVSQPHTRSDIIIRYGRDGLNGRLTRLRQERMRRLARLALICASQEDNPASSAEEKILREICKDAPLHPTVPDFV